MLPRSPRKIAVPPAVGICPSCDGDVPAGNRFCGTCGAPAQRVETEHPTEQELATQRHAELLGGWLEPDVTRSPRLKRALLGSVIVPFLLAGAYLLLQGRPAEPLGATTTASLPPSDVAVEHEPNVPPVDVTPRPAPLAPRVTVRPRPKPRPAAVTRVARRTDLVARAPGLLEMLVTPWASVSIDGRAAIRRARGVDTLVAGIPHRVRFERPGFATIDTIVTLRSGEQRLLDVQMTATKP